MKTFYAFGKPEHLEWGSVQLCQCKNEIIFNENVPVIIDIHFQGKIGKTACQYQCYSDRT